ncbi:hypothetical protein [Synechococcus elongatus]|uniref:Cell division protein FtsL n=2 Tax=Synechococcus elongatus TaxID=32046 RepID=A0AAN1QLV7_SYNEL|nr:hypothetical protein [Synechococcus elongatus]AZB71534.1 hypothetical protein DOP62_01240 [Synechococcus elongatus PCC 11801]QFZ91067.1 hypothetical protein EKO22_00540 [Synechococcus elongatus PCC 11802]
MVAVPARSIPQPRSLTVVTPTTTPRSRSRSATKTRSLPWLGACQKIGLGLGASLGAGVLGVYCFNVYLDSRWSRDFRQLDHLRQQELKLTATTALLRDEVLEQGQQTGQGWVSAKPSDLIFLQPAPPRPAEPAPESQPQAPAISVGY